MPDTSLFQDDFLTQYDIDNLLESEHLVQCPQCNAVSAYCPHDANMDNGTRAEDRTEDVIDVYPIGACSGLGEWQCGKCRAYWVREDSILLAPMFTHSED